MQINLSDRAAAIALQQAELLGYGNDVAAYITHLVVENDAPPAGVPSPKTRQELDALLEEGMASGVAEGSWEGFMSDLRANLHAKMQREAS